MGKKDKITEVQIIGTQRSGSNLLRLMLMQLKGVFAPHPPHIVDTFYPMLPYYGELDADENFKKLIDDICRFIELNPVPWNPLVTDRNLIYQMTPHRSLTGIFRSVYEVHAIENNAGYWLCKSMQNVKYLDYFEDYGFRPKIIYLYRDGRDVALSFKNTIVGPKHVYFLARKWKAEQELSLKYLEKYPSDRIISLSYESLLRNPGGEIRRICDFLGLEYNDHVFEYYDSEESIKTAGSGRMWSNLNKPIIRNNYGKFKKSLKSWEIELFEHIAGGMLERLGYDLLFPSRGIINNISHEKIVIYERENIKMLKEVLNNADPEELKKRGNQQQLIESIKKRWKIDI